MRSPLGEPIRSESVAGMDMLNDMFQRQVRNHPILAPHSRTARQVGVIRTIFAARRT